MNAPVHPIPANDAHPFTVETVWGDAARYRRQWRRKPYRVDPLNCVVWPLIVVGSVAFWIGFADLASQLLARVI